LKYFSLTSYDDTRHYDRFVVPLLGRMTHLEKLTLYLRIRQRSLFVDGTHLHNDILVHMPQLHAFIYYISTEAFSDESVHHQSHSDIQQTFNNMKYGSVECIIDNFPTNTTICHVYSLPFTFTRLEKISNRFPNIVFNSVTHLYAYDTVPMEHDFFMRISQAFPILKRFSMKNEMMQTCNHEEWKSYSIIEYSHLISLDIMHVNIDYVEQFLLETKTHLPHLTELKVNYEQLIVVTRNFTKDTTRHNCSKVKRLIIGERNLFSKEVYQYFPSV
jgi:hypothetical protein